MSSFRYSKEIRHTQILVLALLAEPEEARAGGQRNKNGHSSIGITADIYRHVRTGEMHEEAMRFAPLNGLERPA